MKKFMILKDYRVKLEDKINKLIEDKKMEAADIIGSPIYIGNDIWAQAVMAIVE